MTDISGLTLAGAPEGLVLKHPITKENMDIQVFCVSVDHPKYRQKAFDLLRLKAVKLGADNKATFDPTIAIEQAEESLAFFITGWCNISLDGLPFDYSQENAVRLLKEFPWIKEQIDEFCGKRENFMKPQS